MNENDKTPNMPIVNLMDPSAEPTFHELKFMMKDVQERATRKWHKARDTYWDEINAMIRGMK